MARKAAAKSTAKKDPPTTKKKQSRPKAKGAGGAKAAKVAPTGPVTTPAPTHEQIAQRANDIWRASGCPWGEAEKHWHEAERQLKQELGIM